MIKNLKKNNGYSLIETIVYTALLVMLVGAITFGTKILLDAYKRTKTIRQIEVAALDSMDRMTREIRNADSVDGANSAYNASPGVLQLISGGGATTTKFYISGQKLFIDENGSSIGTLTNTGIKVSSLVFRHIQATSSEAIKVELTLTSSSTPVISKNFYDSAVVRGSYK